MDDRASHLLIALCAATLIAAAASLFIGYAPLSASTVIDGLVNDTGTAGVIMRDIRLPRMLLGLIAGAALCKACSGIPSPNPA
jgi:iron complex transport system permease protein